MTWPRNKELSFIKSCRLVKELSRTRETARLRQIAIFDLKLRLCSVCIINTQMLKEQNETITESKTYNILYHNIQNNKTILLFLGFRQRLFSFTQIYICTGNLY